MSLELVTAGESHGPALVAILTGLPAGLRLDAAAIAEDLERRRQGYGRSPRQKFEADEVDVLAGLRHGVTLGTPLALVVRNRDHKNWTWGMSPWPPEGEAVGKGTSPVTLPAGRRREFGPDRSAATCRCRASDSRGHRGSRVLPDRGVLRSSSRAGQRSPLPGWSTRMQRRSPERSDV